MKKIELLDCTLRDGGYVNDNLFYKNQIYRIVHALEAANIDIIECGYLVDTIETRNEDKTEFSDIKELTESNIISSSEKSEYTLMLLGEKYNIEKLKNAPEGRNNLIRMSFHKRSLAKALENAKIILSKGYRLFMQPTVIMNYSEEEIVEMLEQLNQLKLEGVAIVDTFGQMSPNDIERMVRIFDSHLKSNIKLGLHAHNNLQMAYANAIKFIETASSDRMLVIDSSLYGIGRGAGNLPTELIVSYLNSNYNKNYNLDEILEVNDSIIKRIKQTKQWGYSLPYYLSAIYRCHPSYVLYLLNKNMVSSKDIRAILKSISEDKKSEYDKSHISEIYQAYNDNSIDDSKSYQKIGKIIGNKEVVLIGPGKSINDYKERIEKYINSTDSFVITVNNPQLFLHDACFYSNNKRYNENAHDGSNIEFVTSNILLESKKNTIVFDYINSLSRKGSVSDNALLMLLNILEKLGCKKVTLAGFDGFSLNSKDNFYRDNVSYVLDNNYIKELNGTIRKSVKQYKKVMHIKSLSPSKNIESE